ncbi:MAG: 50S ribosomal protein L7/L12 [Deltaproteobacteria bacterium]|nr:50S ribosomal protein L7/L12 [Deltaproteobacteria bacterium]
MAEVTHEQVVDYLSNLPVMQISELISELEEKWGVKAAPAAVAVAGLPAAAAGEAAAAEEQTEFDVILTGFGTKKIQVIKVVREITGLGLKEAKELVEGVPKPVKEQIAKQEAEDIKKWPGSVPTASGYQLTANS